MRRTKDREILFAMVALAAFIGCDSKPKGTGTGPAAGTGGETIVTGPNARQAADAFLVALRDRTATPDQLTQGLRAAIAPPMTDQDKKTGYSNANAQEWLAKFRDTRFIAGEESKFGNAIVLRGRAESPTKKEAFALRLVKDANGYKADWLQTSGHLSSNIPTPLDADLAAAQDTVRNMLDLLVGDSFDQAHVLMTLAWKKAISPLGDARVQGGLEYEPGFLKQKLRSWAGGATGYTLSDGKLNSSRNGASFVVDLEKEGKKVPHTVKVKKDPASGWWLVDGFDKAPDK